MKRRRLLGSLGACALAALGISAAASQPATAQEDHAIASAGVVAAMQRDLGLTEAQAVSRLGQESAAIRIGSAARAAAGTAYGGSWFDAERGRLVVGLVGLTTPAATSATSATAAAVRATGAEVATVEHTKAELDAVTARLDGADAPDDVAGWHVDPRSGSVVVTVRRGTESRADVGDFLALARKAGPVTVETTTEMPATFAAGTVGGDPYYINGNVRCSIGFSVNGGFVSAGHCGSPGSTTAGWDGSAQGTFVGSSFPDNDYSFIRIGNGWWTVGVVLGWGTVADRPVRGSGVAPVGSSICRSGSTTHWHCGTVLGLNETVNYSQGAVHQLTHTNVCAEPGDSGGSFITGDQAQGVTSGGWGNCGSGGETWFQPVNEILGVYGLSLVTI